MITKDWLVLVKYDLKREGIHVFPQLLRGMIDRDSSQTGGYNRRLHLLMNDVTAMNVRVHALSTRADDGDDDVCQICTTVKEIL